MKKWSINKHNAVLKYMNLRIKGIGAALTNEEIDILHQMSEKEWKDVSEAIIELGGKPSVKPVKPWRIA